jgi:O-methyltransferase involved in polyketide biosynthesis
MDVKKGESSLTALISAFGRAYHSQFDTPKIFDDFLAKQLMTQEEYDAIKTHMVQGISFFNPEMAEQHRDNPDEILKWITQVQLSPTPLARAAYCEAVLQKEIESGVKQYVILGARHGHVCPAASGTEKQTGNLRIGSPFHPNL